MGLLLGLGLLAAAAVPDAYRSFKARAYSDWETETYGYESMKARNVVLDIISQTNSCEILYGFKVLQPGDGVKLQALYKKYLDEKDPKAWFHAIHDFAEEFCKEHDIPFSGKYVNTFYLPGHSIYTGFKYGGRGR